MVQMLLKTRVQKLMVLLMIVKQMVHNGSAHGSAHGFAHGGNPTVRLMIRDHG